MAGSFKIGQGLALGWGNKCHHAHVIDLQTDGFTTVAGHPVENLLYPDASLYMLTDVISGHPTIRMELSAAFDPGCLGFYNHTLFTGEYDSIKLSSGASITGPWLEEEVATVGATPTDWDPDLLLRTNHPIGSTAFWKIQFVQAGPWPTLRLGGLFLGSVHEMEKNVNAQGGFFMPHVRPSGTVRAPGGAKHRAKGARWTERSAQAIFTRLPRADVQALGSILHQSDDDTVAIVPPGTTGEVMPTDGLGHFFGYLVDMTPGARPGVNVADHRQDMTLSLEGVQ